MSSVKIQGSATGTAAFTIAVPDGTSTDRTIELPDAAGSFVLADASGDVAVTGAFTSQGIDDNATSTAMTLDSSGNVLVGKTATASIASDTPGHTFYSSGTARHIVDGGEVMNIVRQTSDGNIVGLYRDGSLRGILGNSTTALYITNGSTTGIKFGANAFYPTIGDGSNIDNSKDVGTSGVRFDDVYATNGTIQTSDANEKQQIAPLTDAEIIAAKAISKLFKTFKWNDKVAQKGDAARTHTGVIAQEVQQAMTDAGLDAGNYAFFISSTWWETQTEVPAVEAVDEVVDEDGNVVTEAVEAQEAYTRTDTYETAEEAPEGAVERTRLGIRYPELLAFIGAATEQRLASIEARLDALEAV